MAPTETEHSSTKSKTLGRIGIGLILLSGVFFFTMLSVPFWPLATGPKAGIAAALFVGVQVAWWVGATLVGPATLKLIFSKFRRSQQP